MTARAKDHDEIVRVMHLYVDGFNDNDVGKFKEAFHDDAWIFYVDADGRLTKNLISESFAHLVDGGVQAVVEVDEGIGGPEFLLQLFACDEIAGALQ